jgi:enoyl-CoA hydratase/carnithine racemase
MRLLKVASMSAPAQKPRPAPVMTIAPTAGSALARAAKPFIAAVNGAAFGIGMSMILQFDVIVACDAAKFGMLFIKVGLGGCDVGVSYLLPRLVGGALSAELLLTGRDLTAERALRLGLVSELVPQEELEAAAAPYVEAMLATAPLGLALTKEVLNANLDAPGFEAALALEDRNQVLLSQTRDFREGAAAFREKRPPRFEGR